MVRKWILAFLLAAGFVMTGCDLFGEDEEEGGISGTIALSATTADVSSGTVDIKGSGTLTASENITGLTVTVMDPSGSDAKGKGVMIMDHFTAGTTVDLATAVHIMFKSTALAGAYSVTITATGGGSETPLTATLTVTVTSNAAMLTSSEVTLGAQGASAGSYLDVDAMQDYNSSAASSNQAKIDVIFGITGGAATLHSPKDAKDAGFIPTWTTLNTTMFHTVSATFADVKYQYEIDALWVEASAGQRSPIGNGGVYVVKTSEGKYALIEVAQASSNATTATVKIKGLK